MSFFFVPTQQQISQATSVLTVKYKVYFSSLNLKFSSPKGLFGFRPHLLAGAGGIIINPESVTLNRGIDNSTTIDAETDKIFSGTVAIGFTRQIAGRLAADITAQRFFFNLEDANNDRVRANNNYLGIGLIWMF